MRYIAHCLPPPIDLPPAIAATLNYIWRQTALAVAGFLALYGAPADARRRNAGAGQSLGRVIAQLRRMQKILRYLFIVYARYFARETTFASPRARVRKSAPVRPRHRERRDDPLTWRVAFLTPRAWRQLMREVRGPQPLWLAHAGYSPMLVIARKMEGLRRVLEAPMPFVRQLALRMRREVFLAPSIAKRRTPPANRRALWEELQDARHAAWWALHRQNAMFDSS